MRMAVDTSQRDLRHERGTIAVESERYPETAVGYDEAHVPTLFARNGLEIGERIHYRSWCGRSEAVSVQDVIVASTQGAPI
jgi:hypothetical protein